MNLRQAFGAAATRVLALLVCLAIHGATLAAATGLSQPPEVAPRMQPYVFCDGFAGGVRGITLDRRPPGAAPWREVGFGADTARVSVLDGYRVMYSYPRTLPFANLKAERSDPVRYGEDKRIVSENFAAIAQADDNTMLESFAERGFAGQTLTKKELGGTTLGITQIFADEDAIIVTVFFLNQAPEYRWFQTHAEFVAVRDSFVRGYVECVATRKSAAALSRSR